MAFHWRPLPAFALLFAMVEGGVAAAQARALQIDGPQGPLEGELNEVAGSPATVIIIPGSGPTDRDGNSPGGLASNSYRLLAEALADTGISSLRVDKRGLFGSRAAIPDPDTVTIADYARDISGWVQALQAQPGARCIWLAGHSEGGLVALVAARLQLPLCGLILLATPGRPPSQLMREQFVRNPANSPYLAQLEHLLSILEDNGRVPATEIDPVLRPLFRESLQDHMAQLFTYDPAVVARDVTLPALIVQGGCDIQVTRKDAALLARAMPQARSLVLDRMTHMLKEEVAGAPLATYQQPNLPLMPQLVETISRFVLDNSSR